MTADFCAIANSSLVGTTRTWVRLKDELIRRSLAALRSRSISIPRPGVVGTGTAAVSVYANIENVTLTGEFEPHDKGELWQAIARQGAQVGKNVTKKTTILVAGEWATMTSKEKRAHELKEKGQDIEIWPAERLYEALGL